MKLTECLQCKGQVIEKDVEEIYKNKEVIVHVEECQKCGERYTQPGECSRIFNIIYPPFSEKFKRAMLTPISYLKKLALL